MKRPQHRLRLRAFAATAALGAAVLGCGSGTTAHRAADHLHATDDGVLDVTARDFGFVSEHATVAAGSVPVAFTNEGHEPHQLQIGRLREPMTPEEFIALFEGEGDRASVDAVTWVGGVNVVEPGDTGSATVDLAEGDYLMVCYVPDDSGTSHVMHGMVAALHVGASATDATAAAAADQVGPAETVVLRDFQIAVPQGFRGRGPVAFRNEGTDPHEVVFLRLDEGKTLADAAAYQADPTGDRPFDFAGGVASVAPGTVAVADLDLAPGDYLATCFVPALDGTPHVDLGMLATFTVT